MRTITSSDELAALCQRLGQGPYITIDTEFMRETTFWPRLCLVQMAGPDEAAIVDPLAEGISLEPLADLLADETTLKVFHAARQDIEIFYHMNGRVPGPVFDTQIAAMVCGFGESVGYETLVRKLVKEQVDKSSRFTDWSRRPLSNKQLNYALADVTHLRVIYEKLARRLDRSERTHWLQEEMDVLTAPETYAVHPENAWRRIKTRSRNRRMLAVLTTVAAWREREAQRRDVPRNRVLRDEALLEISAEPPSSVEKLSHVRGLSRGFAEGRHGRDLLAAVEAGLNLPKKDWPEARADEPLPPGLGPLVELLKVLLKMKCETHNVAQKLICNVADLERIAADDDAPVQALHGWRREIFGEDAIALKHGRIALAANGKAVKLVRLSEREMAD
ncbi:MAG: ribonuclease D [Minwuiales bacterium]|nr:ribonuclease D [Minwuiales bacterium]